MHTKDTSKAAAAGGEALGQVDWSGKAQWGDKRALKIEAEECSQACILRAGRQGLTAHIANASPNTTLS